MLVRDLVQTRLEQRDPAEPAARAMALPQTLKTEHGGVRTPA
ncbi:MAG: hypothetical protein Q8Q88_05920 [Phenylobacterium sp.]|nr:hypothetical protein [Phenylobacterium sp.]MDP3746574.1 hypothetical protein [Phenylobacterium sp.]